MLDGDTRVLKHHISLDTVNLVIDFTSYNFRLNKLVGYVDVNGSLLLQVLKLNASCCDIVQLKNGSTISVIFNQ